MELFQARDNFIITDGYYSLWCNRKDGGIVPRQGVPPTEAFDPLCKGKVYGVIGKIQLFPGSEWKLLVITKRTLLGVFPGNHEVYRIDRIVVLPLAQGEVTDLELDLCDKHQIGGKPKGSGDGQQKGFEKTWQSMKSAVTNIKENVKNTNTPKDIKDREKEKLEKRLLEEILKMFNDSDSFLYSPTGDITNTQQKQCGEHYDRSLPLWKRVDERFFWNKYMLQDLISNEDPLCSRWILPVIQGYCQIAHCVNKFEEEEPDDLIEKNRGILPEEEFDLLLISRRSIHRAGTRYKRRGVDEDGEVANFVETEQIVRTEVHSVSFVQVRGSVPIYWSQPGFKYRPPPRLDKDEEETLLAFMSHFAHQLKYYGGVVIVNLIDQTGREKIISDAFMDNILTFNNPLLTYITFDFHEYCRGMKFENVAVLVESIMDVIKDMRYCWTDSKGIICEQRSVFRVNCMDCLDRTNVVQAALARHVMEVQLRKLGKLLPDQNLPAEIRASFQEMWANNGDAISRQYAGTAAMKGDFTRTGERRFTGVMKDGYNSANRYYLNRFKAVYRQTVIDAMLGNPLTEDLTQAMAALKDGDEEYPWTMEREECVAQLVIDCQQLLLSDSEECLGGWALVDPFYNPEGALNQDQDVILLLTNDAYYVASYDDDAEQVTQYERINLEDVEKIEIGFEPSFKSRYLFIRIHYKLQGSSGYFHTLRTIQHRTPDEARGVLLGIADAFTTARSHKSLGIKIAECNKLDKKKSKSPPEVTQISSKSRLSSWSKPKTKVKSKSSLEAVDGDPTKLRAKNSPINLRSFLRDHLTGIPRTYSDPCLAQQDKAEDYKAERKRSGLSSAPISSGSSSSSESDTEESGVLLMRLDQNLEQPMKSATKLECRSDDVLDVLLKTDVNDGDNESSTRVEEDPVELSVCTDNTIHTTDNDVVTTIEDLIEFHTSGDNPQNGTDVPEDIPDEDNPQNGTDVPEDIPHEDSLKNGEYGQVYELDSGNENSTAYIEGMSEMEDVYPPANVEENSEKEHEETDILLKYEKSDGSSIGYTTAEIQDDLSNSQRDDPVDILLKDEKSDGSSIGYTIDEIQDDLSNSQRDEPVGILLKDEKSDGSSIGYTTAKIQDDLSNSQRDDPVDIVLKDEKSNESSIGYTIDEIQDDLSNSQRDEPVEGDTSLDETTLNTEDISKITESYNESKKKLRETPNLLDLNGDDESSGDTLKSDGGANPFIRFGFGGSLRSMTVSFKTSASMSNIEKGANNVDESLEQEANKRFSTGILGNRSPNTSRSGKGNNFAQKSKNFIPELRNKLSMSFNRARSPRLEHKQTSVSSVSVDDTPVEHKKHKRKHKCLTKIIEI